MKFIKNLIPFHTKLDFVKYSKTATAYSFILIILTFLCLIVKGVNIGIDFTGGTIIEVKSEKIIDLEQIKTIFTECNLQGASVQYFGSPNEIFIKLKTSTNVVKQLKTLFAENNLPFEYRKIDYIGPQVGQDMVIKGFVAIFLALLGIIIYLWVRFGVGFSFVGAGLLIHDVLLIVGFFSITQIEFNLPSVAAILTIIGYSINDTVVIFDRLRSNLRKLKDTDLAKTINLSINHTLSRTILTSFTTLIAIIPMLILTKGEIQYFILIITLGIIVGTYSSIFLAPQGLLYAKVTNKEKSPLKLPEII